MMRKKGFSELTPTLYPSPQGGGRPCALRPICLAHRSNLRRDDHDSLPLVGRDKGWGYSAAVAGIVHTGAAA